jgi:EmrB/QacA subfamily drug resistance transporter
VLRKWHGNPWAILLVLCLGFFMTLVDLTIVNVALPDMADSLNTTLDDLLWFVSAYTLALAVLIITAGRLGDRHGKGNLFIYGVALFTLSSLACGLAQSPGQLIAFRAAQGIGAALLIPQTLSIIADVFPGDKRGAALGVWGTVAGVSGAIGPSLGGWLVSDFGWRWVFLINLPIGALVLLLAVPIMPKASRTVSHRFDIPGVALASLALLCLSFGLVEGERYSWNRWIWTLLLAAGILLVAFLFYERGQQDKEPLLPFSLFRDRNFSIVNLAGFAVSFSVVGLLLPTTIYMQSVLGFSPLRAGLALLPLAVGSMITAGPAGVLSEKFGGRVVLAVGLAAFGGGMLWFLLSVSTTSSWASLLAPIFITGLGAGCTFAPMGSEVMRNVPPRLIGAASGANNAIRQVGAVLAGAILGAVLQTQYTSALRDHATKSVGALPQEYRAGFLSTLFGSTAQGVQIGPAQSAASPVPAGVPDAVARTMRELVDQAFRHSLLDAVRPAMLVAVLITFLGSVACLFLKGGPTPAGSSHGLPVTESEATATVATHR